MKVTILTYGSRGDVQPFVALANGLMKRGHEVKFAAPHRFANIVGAYKVPFVPLAGDPEEMSRRINDAGTNAIRIISSIKDYVFAIAPQVSRSAFQACEDADLLIHSFLFTVGAHSWAREHSIPDVSVQGFPMFAPTREFPSVAMSQLPPGVLSYLSHWVATQAFWYGGNMGYGPARRANPDIPYPEKLYWPFDADPVRPRTPMLCAWSQNVLPRPSDWPPNIHVTGYFFLDADPSFQPPADLQEFLDAGKPPVCISFGSMINRNAERIDQIVRDALAKTGQRGIFLSGWSNIIHESSKDIFYCNDVPHDWLLSRCEMIIHHGGAGTTSSGLRAGIPNIVVPFTADQPFWGKRVYAIGAGPQPILVKHLSIENLTNAMAEAEDENLRNRAKDLGQRIRSEDGVEQAIGLIEGYESKYKSE
jgi:sterol 3beta-glucosyltransferase